MSREVCDVPCAYLFDLESCAFDQASLPLLTVRRMSGGLPAEPYFMVALPVLKVKFFLRTLLFAFTNMPKPETVSMLCTKCHSKTVHEVRGKTVAGTKLVCTDCAHETTVTSI